jgi:hypothetical protein
VNEKFVKFRFSWKNPPPCSPSKGGVERIHFFDFKSILVDKLKLSGCTIRVFTFPPLEGRESGTFEDQALAQGKKGEDTNYKSQITLSADRQEITNHEL